MSKAQQIRPLLRATKTYREAASFGISEVAVMDHRTLPQPASFRPTRAANAAITAGFGSLGILLRHERVLVAVIPVSCPFLDVSDHVVQSITIGRE